MILNANRENPARLHRQPRGRSEITCPRETVAIVGGGCAGVLVAAHLMGIDGHSRHIVVFEPRPELGAGVAYSTDDPRHVLNVPARSMSAFDAEPADFVAWLAGHHPGLGADDFVPRRIYRRYLGDVLRRAEEGAPPGTTLTWVHEPVTDLATIPRDGRSVTAVRFGRHGELTANHVVLAVGAPAPTTLASIDVPRDAVVVTDPWRPGALGSVPADGDVLILGTGLTMVDVALALAGRTGDQVIHARSRRGLLPAEHTSGGFTPWPGLDLDGATTARDVLHALRAASAAAGSSGGDWRNVISAARTVAPEVWGHLSATERRRLLRHAAPYWDAARHRMAPDVAASVDDLRCRGRLDVGPGRVVEVRPSGTRAFGPLVVTLTRPGRHHETLRVRALVDCTGVGTPSALVTSLVADGAASLDPSGLGLAVDDHGDLVSEAGEVAGGVHAIGWCRRGSLFESTAVPELRVQASRLAQRVADGAAATAEARGRATLAVSA